MPPKIRLKIIFFFKKHITVLLELIYNLKIHSALDFAKKSTESRADFIMHEFRRKNIIKLCPVIDML